MEFNEIIGRLALPAKSTVALAAAEDDVVLRAVVEARNRGIADAILCGNRERISALAGQLGLDVTGFEIVHTESATESARAAVSLVRQKKAGMLMKGMLSTADLLRAVLDREDGLRKSEVLSHVSVLHSPVLERMFLLTDAAMVPYPDLAAKIKLIENAVEAAAGLGMERPAVAPLAAVEVVNPNMPATLDAAALSVMNARGQIKGCVVDGPLAMDIAISESAARHKNVDSPAAGRADILLFHNIEAANSALKAFTHAGGCLFGGIIMGAAAPVILTSRSDSMESKLYSIACAAAVSGAGNIA